MNSRHEKIRKELHDWPRRWLVTGAAGFIGSHLVEALLRLDQYVVGLDNLSTGHIRNIEAVRQSVGTARSGRFRFIHADVTDPPSCTEACRDIEIVLHQAALGSVPRSMTRPEDSHASNVDGFFNVLRCAHGAGVLRVVFASSSSVYGDDPSDTKQEDRLGRPLSPYAATKRINEVYAEAFQSAYGLDVVGLRYFNVFGPRQDPDGPYAAVIPRWTELLLRGEPCMLFGDGTKTRDFCYVDNVVQANLLAATAPSVGLSRRVFNIACGHRTSLRELFAMIDSAVRMSAPGSSRGRLMDAPPSPGDIPHSLADIAAARAILGYEPTWDVERGIEATVRFFANGPSSRRPLDRIQAAPDLNVA
jgi:UDP-N-acetylglucosamine 4-epimerase